MFPIHIAIQDSPKPQDRRRAGRVRCFATSCQFGTVADFSRTGVKVMTRRVVKVPAGQTVNLQIEASGAKIVVPARVVSSRPSARGGYETGFEFWGVDERWQSALSMMGRIASDEHAVFE